MEDSGASDLKFVGFFLCTTSSFQEKNKSFAGQLCPCSYGGNSHMRLIHLDAWPFALMNFLFPFHFSFLHGFGSPTNHGRRDWKMTCKWQEWTPLLDSFSFRFLIIMFIWCDPIWWDNWSSSNPLCYHKSNHCYISKAQSLLNTQEDGGESSCLLVICGSCVEYKIERWGCLFTAAGTQFRETTKGSSRINSTDKKQKKTNREAFFSKFRYP